MGEPSLFGGPDLLGPRVTKKSETLLSGVFALLLFGIGFRGTSEPLLDIFISYGATDPLLFNRQMYPSFFQTLPSDQTQYQAIVKLLRYFDWTWIGIIVSDDEGGNTQSQYLMKEMEVHDICSEFILKLPSDHIVIEEIKYEKNKEIFKKSISKIVVLCGTISILTSMFLEEQSIAGYGKTLIIPAGSNTHILSSMKKQTSYHGSLIFSSPEMMIPQLKKFLEDVSLENRPNDPILEHIFFVHLSCMPSDPNLKIIAEEDYQTKLTHCNKTMKLQEIGANHYYTKTFTTTYHVYQAVYAMAHALHEAHLHMSRNFNWKQMLKFFLRRLHFQDPMGEDIYFNEKGEMTSNYQIINFVLMFPTVFILKNVGTFNSSLHEDHLLIDTSKIVWKNGKIPVSKCSEDCPPGYRRILMRGRHKCCFECLKCLDGKISNDTAILGIFILLRDTPVVKANNQSLSFILLVSIMLSFLCVFLFLGRPIRITCMLRQTLFGIIFSVTISSILAKTITVYMAFKATKPGSSWRKFIGVKITNCLVFICSFVQVVISIIWLSFSPPFPESNFDLYVDKIILQCNEGSVVAFSIVLGYMGFLAAVSFLVAFLVRNLPGSFNEAKNITFSMLVVCSVWMAFIPAYMSITGKNTVIVEIFAIISSNVGILGCLFFPKCYIILVRADLNSKEILLHHK
ncbi:vomeronasal type-2 receptor 26-like [Eleutherodactylus coqui]|uniref:vomeronasal type-2 receptor 26-like n=1 Tax=Eleutherodactylus coqui TaxID=57060 RepID=UPI003462877F